MCRRAALIPPGSCIDAIAARIRLRWAGRRCEGSFTPLTRASATESFLVTLRQLARARGGRDRSATFARILAGNDANATAVIVAAPSSLTALRSMLRTCVNRVVKGDQRRAIVPRGIVKT